MHIRTWRPRGVDTLVPIISDGTFGGLFSGAGPRTRMKTHKFSSAGRIARKPRIRIAEPSNPSYLVTDGCEPGGWGRIGIGHMGTQPLSFVSKRHRHVRLRLMASLSPLSLAVLTDLFLTALSETAILLPTMSTFTLDDASNWDHERSHGPSHAPSHDTLATILPENDRRKADEPAPPQDGGTKAWLQVLGSWMLFLLVTHKNADLIGNC